MHVFVLVLFCVPASVLVDVVVLVVLALASLLLNSAAIAKCFGAVSV